MRLTTGTVQQQQAQGILYMGNKVKHYNQNASGGAYKKRYGGDGNCGCGSKKNPKRMRKNNHQGIRAAGDG